MESMTLLPEELARAQKRAGGLFPAYNAAPLVIQLRQIPVGMNNILKVIAEKGLGGRAHAEPFLKLLFAAVGHPCNLGGKALNMILLLLQQAFGYKHRHINIFMPGLLEHTVNYMLNIFPDCVAVWTDYHAALNGGIVD